MKKYVRKITAFSCALVFGISCTLQKMPEKALKISAETSVSDITDTVRVIVTLKDDSVFDRTGETDTDSDNAAEAFRTVVQEQNTVQAFIRDLYPDFKTNYSYSFLINGFSCELPENLISSVRNNPMVQNVTEVGKSKIPDNTDAYSCGSTAVFENETGCYGEGRVIAIIDNELDASHDMFAPIDSKNNKLSRQDIEDIISDGNGFNGNITDADQVYISSKLPFVFDYADGIVNDPNLYHGTHVAGIAAGNQVEYSGSTVSGAARDAQIIFMGVSDSKGFLYDDAIIAALEDAVRLRADVINMSFSDRYESFMFNNPVKDALSAAENAGIIVCQAAGNDGRNLNSPSDPNIGTINEASSFPGIFSVASAQTEESPCENMTFFHFNGAKINFKNVVVAEYEEEPEITLDFLASLENNEYQLTAPDPKNIELYNVKGKIVIFKADDSITLNRVKNLSGILSKKGAVGMIISTPEYGVHFDKYSYFPYIPCALISSGSADYIIKNINSGTISFGDRNEDADGIMNSFSSWGVSSSLRLKPEISGFGSDILSASKNNGFCQMSGTSMSSPYIAGCAAVAEELAYKRGCLPEGKERSVFIKNLIMNSAVPASYNGIFISPRKQGAGITDMKNLSETSVILTGDGGEAKIELYDNLTDNFSFNVHLNNISDENVSFKKAELVLFTDSAEYYPDYSSYITEGSVILEHKTDLSSLMTIKAGEKKTEIINVRLDSSQTNKHSELFKNGFFIDGYIILSGSENCSDISVPLLGFYGDWNAKQLLRYDKYEGTTEPLSSVIMNAAILYRKNEDYLYYLNNRLSSDGPLYINRKRSGIRNSLPGKFEFSEHCYRTCELVNNEDGSLIFKTEFENNTLRFADNLISPEIRDGYYTMNIKAFTDFYKSIEKPETAEYSFVTDSLPPEAEFSVVIKNGKKLLNVRSNDKNLDGFIITGYKNKNNNSPDPHELLSTAGRRLMLTDSDFSKNELSDLIKMMNPSKETPASRDYNYIDAVSAEGNSFNISYDISDFDYYIAASADKALNFRFFTSDEENNPVIIPDDNDHIFGDTDCSGTVNIADVIFLKHCILDPSDVTDMKEADLNGDMTVDSADLMLLVKLFLNK